MVWKKLASLICLIVAITCATHSLHAMQEQQHVDYKTQLVQFVYNNKGAIALSLASSLPFLLYTAARYDDMPYIFSKRPCVTVNCKNITVTLDTKETMQAMFDRLRSETKPIRSKMELISAQNIDEIMIDQKISGGVIYLANGTQRKDIRFTFVAVARYQYLLDRFCSEINQNGRSLKVSSVYAEDPLPTNIEGRVDCIIEFPKNVGFLTKNSAETEK